MGKRSRVDWKRELRATFGKATSSARGHARRTFARPARRSMSREIITPSRVSVSTDIMVGIDTSGSMSEEDFGFVAGEIDGMLSKQKGKVVAFSIDGSVKKSSVKVLKSIRGINLKGGGGTDMREGFKFIAESDSPITPQIGIILTDGYTPWPTKAWVDDTTNAKGQPIKWIVVGTQADNGQYAGAHEAGIKVIVVNLEEN